MASKTTETEILPIFKAVLAALFQLEVLVVEEAVRSFLVKGRIPPSRPTSQCAGWIFFNEIFWQNFL